MFVWVFVCVCFICVSLHKFCVFLFQSHQSPSCYYLFCIYFLLFQLIYFLFIFLSLSCLSSSDLPFSKEKKKTLILLITLFATFSLADSFSYLKLLQLKSVPSYVFCFVCLSALFVYLFHFSLMCVCTFDQINSSIICFVFLSPLFCFEFLLFSFVASFFFQGGDSFSSLLFNLDVTS